MEMRNAMITTVQTETGETITTVNTLGLIRHLSQRNALLIEDTCTGTSVTYAGKHYQTPWQEGRDGLSDLLSMIYAETKKK